MDNRAVIVLRIHARGFEADLDVPLDVTAHELLLGLNEAYALNIDVSNAANCYLRSENPIALLKGSKTLLEYGIHHGTVINI